MHNLFLQATLIFSPPQILSVRIFQRFCLRNLFFKPRRAVPRHFNSLFDIRWYSRSLALMILFSSCYLRISRHQRLDVSGYGCTGNIISLCAIFSEDYDTEDYGEIHSISVDNAAFICFPLLRERHALIAKESLKDVLAGTRFIKNYFRGCATWQRGGEKWKEDSEKSLDVGGYRKPLIWVGINIERKTMFLFPLEHRFQTELNLLK